MDQYTLWRCSGTTSGWCSKVFHLVVGSLVFASVIFCSPANVHAQTPSPSIEPSLFEQATPAAQEIELPTGTGITYMRGRVTKIVSEQHIPVEDQTFYVQEVEVKLETETAPIILTAGSEFQPLNRFQKLSVGEQVVVSKQPPGEGLDEYVLADMYRIPMMVYLLAGFFILVVLIAGRKGGLSIIGMMLSLIILAAFIIPQIIHGQNPILVVMVGSALTAFVTMYLSHGWHWQSHVALGSMMLTLLAVGLIATAAVSAGKMAGFGSEEVYYLQFGPTSQVNLRGLLLAGILLGALGILDDIALAQTSVVAQLHDAKPEMSSSELYWRALVVGQDHVASLVNTLVMAYAGSSLPLFLLFSVNQFQPAWVTLNSEIIAEEVVRTLAGSIGLVLAVPLTTAVACWAVKKYSLKETSTTTHAHRHRVLED